MGGATRAERLASGERNPKWKNPSAADRHVDLHQLRHVHPPLPAAVRGDLQPRDGRDHHPRAVLGLRQVHRALPGRLHLPRPRLVAGPRGLVGGARDATTRTADDDRFPRDAGAPRRWSSPGGGPPRRARAPRVHRQPRTRCEAWPRRSPPPGFAVELPRLPGHGTDMDDMLPTDVGRLVGDGRGGADRARARARRRGRVVVAGLSMGGTLRPGSPPGTPTSPVSPSSTPSPSRPARWPTSSTRPSPPARRCSRHRLRHRRPRLGGLVLRGDAAAAAAHAARRRRRRCRPTSAKITLPGARAHLAAGPRRAAVEQRPPRRQGVGPGRAGHARAELPRRHPRLRQGDRRGACRRVRAPRSSPAETAS